MAEVEHPLLDRFAGTSKPPTARAVAWACVLGPDSTADPEVPVRLAEVGLKAPSNRERRAIEHARGRAVPRRPVRQGDPPARRRHPAPGRGWFARRMGVPGDGPPPPGASRPCTTLARPAAGPSAERRPTRFWYELGIRLLRSEAEAVILYDRFFPIDPFAH